MTTTLHTPAEHKAESFAQMIVTFNDIQDARRRKDWDSVNRLERILPMLWIGAGIRVYEVRA